MQIIEQFSHSKYGAPARNEDAIVITNDFAAVIDGATDVSGITVNGMTPGRYASQTIAQALTEMPANIDGYDAFKFLSDFLKANKIKKDLPANFNPFCVAAIYSVNRREIFYIRDIQIKLNGVSMGGEIPALEPITTYRQTYLNAMIANGASVDDLLKDDPFHVLLCDLCDYTPALLNNAESRSGWGVINGETIPEKFIEIIPVPEGSDLIMTSDGYPVIETTLQESENRLKQILDEDPLLIGKYPQPRAMKNDMDSFDDRSWLKIKT